MFSGPIPPRTIKRLNMVDNILQAWRGKKRAEDGMEWERTHQREMLLLRWARECAEGGDE